MAPLALHEETPAVQTTAHDKPANAQQKGDTK